MMTRSNALHGILILRDDKVVFADDQAASLLGVAPDRLRCASLTDITELFQPQDAKTIYDALHVDDPARPTVTLSDIHIRSTPAGSKVDLLIDRTIYQGVEAQRMVWIHRSALQSPEDHLRQHVQRLQLLHEIDQAILSIQDEQATALAALSRVEKLVPHYRASSVVLIDMDRGEAHVLALHASGEVGNFAEQTFRLSELAVDLPTLESGQPYILPDIAALKHWTYLHRQMARFGVRSYVSTPLRWGGKLIGALYLASAAPNVFQEDEVQIAQEVADSLAIAIHEARFRRDERQRQQEAEVMRDVMASLASAGDLKQSLEALMVNLHNLITYDRASLFLLDENERLARADRLTAGAEGGAAVYLENHPLVAEMRRTRRPVVVADIQRDSRFSDWPDAQSVHGWLGAPLLAGNQMLGFISLGALKRDAYSASDSETMEMFAAQVAQVLERVRLDEQSQRRSEELEVLSNITFAIGKAEGGSDTLNEMLKQIAQFFNASRGAILVHDRGQDCLAVKAGLGGTALDLIHPYGNDLLWEAIASNQLRVISSVDAYLSGGAPQICEMLFDHSRSAVLIPLASGEAVFGLLSLGFDHDRGFSAQAMRLFHAVAEIVGASLRRAVVLEALENQAAVRTQHLNTLYRINAIASEALPLELVLEQVLEITLDAMKANAGFIHLLDEKGEKLILQAQRNMPASSLDRLETISAQENFWKELIQSPNPLAISDLLAEGGAPQELRALDQPANRAYIGAPLRIKGRSLGALNVFGATILHYSIEDITLFMTIADQISGLVERARLLEQVELAAVIQERQRLARELHDSVTQLLYSQVLFSGASLKELRRGSLKLVEQHLERIEQAAQQALKEMRLLVYELRPPDELGEDLAGTLERRLDSVEKRTGISARLMVRNAIRLDPVASMTLYRIAEEALNNTLKHAQASAVLVTLSADTDWITLEIQDDGRGFDLQESQRSGGMGLANMRERASELGGSLEVISAPGAGTRVIARVKSQLSESYL